jgi:glucose-6-phosphate 1-dehydrogenase
MTGEAVELVARHSDTGTRAPYERLIGDALRGDPTLFTRDDVVEAAWRVIDPVLRAPPPVQPYEPGTWGPDAARGVVRLQGWHDPKHEASAPC